MSTGKYRAPEKTTLGDYLTAWLDRRERDGLRPSTVLGYRRPIGQDIAPAIGHLRVAEVQRHHVSALIARLVADRRVQLGAQVIEGRAKTEKGDVRRVRLGAEAVGALLAWRLQQDAWRAENAVVYQDGGWVFTYEDGQPLRPAYISRVFETLMKQSGLPPLRFHDLRHQHASLLLLAGVPIEAVSKRLGHSTIAITLDTYSHLLDDLDRKMADAVTSVLPPRTPVAHTEHTPEDV